MIERDLWLTRDVFQGESLRSFRFNSDRFNVDRFNGDWFNSNGLISDRSNGNGSNGNHRSRQSDSKQRLKKAIKGKKLLAFAGIARPEKFFATLREMGGQICASRRFSDHHPYSENEIRKLHADAERLNAQLVTTQKDFVRIAEHQREGIFPLPIQAEFGNARALASVLKKLSGKTVRAKA